MLVLAFFAASYGLTHRHGQPTDAAEESATSVRNPAATTARNTRYGQPAKATSASHVSIMLDVRGRSSSLDASGISRC